jgi:hypothetical protein
MRRTGPVGDDSSPLNASPDRRPAPDPEPRPDRADPDLDVDRDTDPDAADDWFDV